LSRLEIDARDFRVAIISDLGSALIPGDVLVTEFLLFLFYRGARKEFYSRRLFPWRWVGWVVGPLLMAVVWVPRVDLSVFVSFGHLCARAGCSSPRGFIAKQSAALGFSDPGCKEEVLSPL